MPLLFLSPLHKASRQIGLYLDPRSSRLELSNSEGHILSYLRSYAPCPIGELHRVFGFRRSTLTGLLDRLETRGWITRSRHPQDRRSIIIDLTPEGRRLAEKLQRQIVELEREIRKRIDRRDLKGFQRVVEAITEVTGVELRRRSDSR